MLISRFPYWFRRWPEFSRAHLWASKHGIELRRKRRDSNWKESWILAHGYIVQVFKVKGHVNRIYPGLLIRHRIQKGVHGVRFHGQTQANVEPRGNISILPKDMEHTLLEWLSLSARNPQPTCGKNRKQSTYSAIWARPASFKTSLSTSGVKNLSLTFSPPLTSAHVVSMIWRYPSCHFSQRSSLE